MLHSQTNNAHLLGLDTYYWTAVNQFFLWGSLSVYFVITFTMYSTGMYLMLSSSPFIGECPSIPNVFLLLHPLTVYCIFSYIFLIPFFLRHKVRQAKAVPLPPPHIFPRRRISTRRSGYAFSHARGFGELVTSGRFLRIPVKTRPPLYPISETPVADSTPQTYRIFEEAQSP
ncbi:phospholipid-transporting ATPase ID-like [Chanodichthys erythropterus]|uniref:phospholipid-transporting ATPase ID-like n=1 Tax=Chanodichthys erythropterus TaxID=933992 RepID=UPI00351F2F61